MMNDIMRNEVMSEILKKLMIDLVDSINENNYAMTPETQHNIRSAIFMYEVLVQEIDERRQKIMEESNDRA